MSVKSKIQSLISAANAKTGESDATLTDAVQTLVDGYGQGGGGDPYEFFNEFNSNGITRLESDRITRIRDYGFAYYPLKSVFLLDCVYTGERSFENCKSLKSMVFVNAESPLTPKLTGYVDSAVESADFTLVQKIPTNLFLRCPLSTLILRQNTVAPLDTATNALGSKFQSGADAKLYVPQALISSYQSASNWSAVLSTGTNQILPIEGSIYETQYVDGTPISS